MNAISPWRIESARLVARCWSAEDAPAFRALLDRNDRHLRPFIPWMRHEPMPLERTRERLAGYRERFLAGEDCRYALCLPEGTLIGELILSPRQGPGSREVGYLLDRDHTGRGYAQEATAAAVRAAFEVIGIERVELRCSPENAPSVRIARALGFVLERTQALDHEDSEGVLSDTQVWVLRHDAFPTTPCARVRYAAYDAAGERLGGAEASAP